MLHSTKPLPNNYKLNILYDINAENPRHSQDNFGGLVLFERNWREMETPKKLSYSGYPVSSTEDFINLVCGYENETNEVYKSGPRKGTYKTEKVKGNPPTYLIGFDIYSHSGDCLTNIEPINTKQKPETLRNLMEKFSGFIFATDKMAKDEGITDPIKVLQAELKEFDAYLRGEVFVGRIIAPDGVLVDTIGGYIGEDSLSDLQLYAEETVENDALPYRERKLAAAISAIEKLPENDKQIITGLLKNSVSTKTEKAVTKPFNSPPTAKRKPAVLKLVRN